MCVCCMCVCVKRIEPKIQFSQLREGVGRLSGHKLNEDPALQRATYYNGVAVHGLEARRSLLDRMLIQATRAYANKQQGTLNETEDFK